MNVNYESYKVPVLLLKFSTSVFCRIIENFISWKSNKCYLIYCEFSKNFVDIFLFIYCHFDTRLELGTFGCTVNKGATSIFYYRYYEIIFILVYIFVTRQRQVEFNSSKFS